MPRTDTVHVGKTASFHVSSDQGQSLGMVATENSCYLCFYQDVNSGRLPIALGVNSGENGSMIQVPTPGGRGILSNAIVFDLAKAMETLGKLSDSTITPGIHDTLDDLLRRLGNLESSAYQPNDTISSLRDRIEQIASQQQIIMASLQKLTDVGIVTSSDGSKGDG